jgi:hypothetical protein
MNRNSLTTAVIAGIAGVAGIANMASAVNLNPDGLGQVLLYPYYTVNAGQQTLLSVVNTTNVGRVVKVRFLEGYNSREVLDFNLYLSRHDVWTATVFSLADLPGGAGGDTSFAGIFTTDNSCTDPALTSTGSFTDAAGNSQGYQQFLNYKYTGSANFDTGPTADARTREGHFEMILMNDVFIASELDDFITHQQPIGVPPDCDSGDLQSATGYAPPTLDPVTGALTAIADGGLFGAASVVNVDQGTFYAYNADAIDGFTYVSLYTAPGSLFPTLEEVNDPLSGLTATSYVFADGVLFTSTYPGPDINSRPVDAVSSLFTADNLMNEYVTSSDAAIGTDWVINFPTKRLYVDAQPGGEIPVTTTTAFAPFEELFGQNTDGRSCVLVGTGTVIYNREEGHAGITTCPISPCPPGQPQSEICLETNVIRFQSGSVLGSILPAQNIAPFGSNGWVNLDLATSGSALSDSGVDGLGHALYAASNGNVFHGLPVTGFEAARFINGNVAGTLANYSGVYRHRNSRDCTNAVGACS